MTDFNSWDGYLEGSQPELDPMMMQAIMQMLLYPQNSRGVPDVYDYDTQAKLRNGYQDVQSSLVGSGALGNGLMGGTGSFAPGAFEPLQLDDKPIDEIESGRLRQMARRGGLDGLIANLVLGDPENGVDGVSASTALSMIQGAMSEDSTMPLSDTDRAEILGSIPTTTDAAGNEVQDWNALSKKIEGITNPYYEEQARLEGPNVRRDSFGRAISMKEQPSPLQEYLQSMGLSDPRQQYAGQGGAVPSIVETDPMYQSAANDIYGMMGQQDAAHKAFTDYETLHPYKGTSSKDMAIERNARAADTEAMDRFGAQAKQGLYDYFAASNSPTLKGATTAVDPTEAVIEAQGDGGGGFFGAIGDYLGDVGDRFTGGARSLTQPTLSRGKPKKAEQEAMAKLALKLPSKRPTLSGFADRTDPRMLAQASQGARKRTGDASYALKDSMIPFLALQLAGRTPFRDQVQQRSLPMFTSGGMGMFGQ